MITFANFNKHVVQLNIHKCDNLLWFCLFLFLIVLNRWNKYFYYEKLYFRWKSRQNLLPPKGRTVEALFFLSREDPTLTSVGKEISPSLWERRVSFHLRSSRNSTWVENGADDNMGFTQDSGHFFFWISRRSWSRSSLHGIWQFLWKNWIPHNGSAEKQLSTQTKHSSSLEEPILLPKRSPGWRMALQTRSIVWSSRPCSLETTQSAFLSSFSPELIGGSSFPRGFVLISPSSDPRYTYF